VSAATPASGVPLRKRQALSGGMECPTAAEGGAPAAISTSPAPVPVVLHAMASMPMANSWSQPYNLSPRVVGAETGTPCALLPPSNTVLYNGYGFREPLQVEAASQDAAYATELSTAERLGSTSKPLSGSAEHIDALREQTAACNGEAAESDAADFYVTNASNSGTAGIITSGAQLPVVEADVQPTAMYTVGAQEDMMSADNQHASSCSVPVALSPAYIDSASSVRLSAEAEQDEADFSSQPESFTNGSLPSSMQSVSLEPGTSDSEVLPVQQETPLLTVCGMSPLSPIRECAEGGSTPKVSEREAQSPDPHIVSESCRLANGGGPLRMDCAQHYEDPMEKAQLPSTGREKYEQIKRRFLEATRPADLKPLFHH